MYMRVCKAIIIIYYTQDDDDEEEEEDTGYLDLAYLTGNTTCRVQNNTNTSCYSSISFNQQFAVVTAAFVS